MIETDRLLLRRFTAMTNRNTPIKCAMKMPKTFMQANVCWFEGNKKTTVKTVVKKNRVGANYTDNKSSARFFMISR